MAKRHSDALMIGGGACNPSGIAHAIVAACRETREEGGNVRTDPAIRIMVYQLAFLMGFEPMGSPNVDWCGWEDACRSHAPESVS